jgi:catechol 2,3-dioxygenase-like lactoylglutathione lyase family enzyme
LHRDAGRWPLKHTHAKQRTENWQLIGEFKVVLSGVIAETIRQEIDLLDGYLIYHRERALMAANQSALPSHITRHGFDAIEPEVRGRNLLSSDAVESCLEADMQTANIRYIVKDVDQALSFYRDLLGFTVEMHPAPGFALLSQGVLRLYLNAPRAGGAGMEMPDGTVPEPGGWNRIQIETADLDARVKQLREQGATFRNEIVEGQGGRQILLEDPSGNLVELFEPRRRSK